MSPIAAVAATTGIGGAARPARVAPSWDRQTIQPITASTRTIPTAHQPMRRDGATRSGSTARRPGGGTVLLKVLGRSSIVAHLQVRHLTAIADRKSTRLN